MSVHQYANNAQTTLSGSATSGATSISVTSADGFPAQGKFTIIVDSEIMLVTGVSGTTFTVTRAAESTTAATHDKGATVTAILTKGSFLDAHHFDVRNYGATGDGTTDDTTAVQAALTAAENAGGGVVYFPPGTYRATAAMTVGDKVVVRGAGPSSVIKVDHTSYGFYAAGSLGTLYALASDAARGDGTITVDSGDGANFSAGDMIWVQSEAQATSVSGHKKGELQFINAVSTDTLTLPGVLSDAYATDDTAKAGVVTPREGCGIENLAMFNTNYAAHTTTPCNALIQLDLAHNAFVRDCDLHENNGAGVNVRNCMNVTVQGCTIEQMRNDEDNSVLGYGVIVGHGSRNVSVADNNMRYCRHGITTGSDTAGLTGAYGIGRGLSFTGNTVFGTTHFGIDTHEDSEGVTISGNSIVGSRDGGGIQIRCYDANVAGNTIHSVRGAGIYVRSNATDTVISGNSVMYTREAPDSSLGYGIYLTNDHCTVTGNRVLYSDNSGIQQEANTMIDLLIANNTCMNNGQLASTGDGIRIVHGGSRIQIIGNTCSDDQGTATQRYGIRIETDASVSDSTTIANNMLQSNKTSAYSNGSSGTPNVWNNAPGGAPGFSQIKRITTGAVAASSTADVTVTWPVSFGDTSYTITAACQGTNGQLTVRGIGTVGASTCVIRVENKGGAEITGTLHAVGVHD